LQNGRVERGLRNGGKIKLHERGKGVSRADERAFRLDAPTRRGNERAATGASYGAKRQKAIRGGPRRDSGAKVLLGGIIKRTLEISVRGPGKNGQRDLGREARVTPIKDLARYAARRSGV